MRSFVFCASLSFALGGCATWNLPPTSTRDAGASPSVFVERGELAPGAARFRASVCAGIDLHPTYETLDEQSVVAFLKGQGFSVRAARARSDLVFVEVRAGAASRPVRLRVAILGTGAQAGDELHAAVREHGEGSWGVHRANLAVLLPEGRVEDIAAFAATAKLACWGVVTVAGADDAFVIPGGYREL